MRFKKLGFFCALFATHLAAQGEEEISVVTGPEYGPFVDQTIPSGGVYTQLVTNILKSIKYPYQLKYLPWARGYNMVKEGKASLTFPYIKTPERLEEIVYAKTHLMEGKRYVLTSIDAENKTPAQTKFEDFVGSVFCLPVGYAVEIPLKNMVAQKKMVIKSEFDEKTCIAQMAKGTYDLTATNAFDLAALKKSGQYQGRYRVLEIPLAINKLHVIFSKKVDKKFIQAFDQETEKYMQTKEYKELIKDFSL